MYVNVCSVSILNYKLNKLIVKIALLAGAINGEIEEKIKV